MFHDKNHSSVSGGREMGNPFSHLHSQRKHLWCKCCCSRNELPRHWQLPRRASTTASSVGEIHFVSCELSQTSDRHYFIVEGMTKFIGVEHATCRGVLVKPRQWAHASCAVELRCGVTTCAIHRANSPHGAGRHHLSSEEILDRERVPSNMLLKFEADNSFAIGSLHSCIDEVWIALHIGGFPCISLRLHLAHTLTS